MSDSFSYRCGVAKLFSFPIFFLFLYLDRNQQTQDLKPLGRIYRCLKAHRIPSPYCGGGGIPSFCLTPPNSWT